MKTPVFATSLSLMLAATAAIADSIVPEVSNVSMWQSVGSRKVNITYTLANAPAIVIVDICTNGISIGDANLHYFTGDCNKVVQPGANKRVAWQSIKAWPGHEVVGNDVTAKVYAWPLDNPPDYMVADLIVTSNVTYYTSLEAFPDGGLTNDVYRTDRIVMRRIHAAGETFTMGSQDLNSTDAQYARETLHQAQFDHDYWMGIYELTGRQYVHMCGTGRRAAWVNHGDGMVANGDMRPMINLNYNHLRESSGNSGDSTYRYPNDPAPDSVLGRLRAKTGVAFDLPGDAEWEYACRAGTGSGVWNDGSAYRLNFTQCNTSASGGAQNGGSGRWGIDANLSQLARYSLNNGQNNKGGWGDWWGWDVNVDKATARVGSYRPNAWGLYDMHGNAPEICLDYFKVDISGDNGAINTTPNADDTHVLRGGSFQLGPITCRSASRQFLEANKAYNYSDDLRGFEGGCRLVCRIGE